MIKLEQFEETTDFSLMAISLLYEISVCVNSLYILGADETEGTVVFDDAEVTRKPLLQTTTSILVSEVGVLSALVPNTAPAAFLSLKTIASSGST